MYSSVGDFGIRLPEFINPFMTDFLMVPFKGLNRTVRKSKLGIIYQYVLLLT